MVILKSQGRRHPESLLTSVGKTLTKIYNSDMNSSRHYFHCASKGLEDDVLFASRAQFIAGMNRVGLCSLTVREIIIFAFVLMDNHVHFILYGTEEDCRRFMAQYKRLTCIYSVNSDGKRQEDFEYDCWLIPNKEKLMEKICYVLRNPFVAGMKVLPTNYLWGSGPLMFTLERPQQFRPLGDTSEYARRKLFGTKKDIPSDWLVNDEGLIWPGSYTDVNRAESVFGSASRFMYELGRKNEDLINQEMYGGTISLRDSDLIPVLERIAGNVFGDGSLDCLTVDERLELIREARKAGNTDIKQLGRILHIKYQDLKQIW